MIETKTMARWMIIVVGLALLVGYVVGAGSPRTYDSAYAVQNGTAPAPQASPVQAELEQTKKILEDTNIQWSKTIEGLRVCNEQYATSTILVSGPSGGFALSVSPSSGHFGIQTQGGASGVWVIPQHVRRVMALNSTGSEMFYYTDLRTGKLDGPYVPLPATPKTWAESQ